jgi:hypothetical protein
MTQAMWSWGTDVYLADDLSGLRKADIANRPMKDGSYTVVV